MHSPVEQFAIKVLFALNLFGFDIQFTNSLFMVLAVLVSSGFLFMALSQQPSFPVACRGWVMLYEFVADMVRSNVGSEGKPYFPFILRFSFLCCFQFVSLIPTATQQQAKLLSLLQWRLLFSRVSLL